MENSRANLSWILLNSDGAITGSSNILLQATGFGPGEFRADGFGAGEFSEGESRAGEFGADRIFFELVF